MNWLRTLVAWGIFAAAVVTVEAAAGPLVTDPGSCTSGRVYLGNINESHPHHVQYNGLYIVQPNLSLTSSLSSDKPIYKHESRDLYLYHLSFSGPLIPDQWVIGSKPGHHDIALSSDTSTGAWRLWDKNTRTMVTSDLIKAQCVGREDVQTCNTGTLFLSGLSRSRFPSQMSRMGEYRLLTEVASLRPVYQQVGGAEEYLFYRDGMWWIGPDSGRSYGSMFNTDGAWRPEYIRDSWVVYKGNYLSQQPSVIITCSSSAAAAAAAAANEGQGQESGSRDFHRQSDYRHNDDDDDSTDDQDLIPSSSLPSSSSSAESSAMNPGVSCKENQINLAGLEVVSATGHSLLDIMFLRCTGNSRMTGSPGVLCRKDGTWSNPPVCERPAHLITPQQEVRAP